MPSPSQMWDGPPGQHLRWQWGRHAATSIPEMRDIIYRELTGDWQSEDWLVCEANAPDYRKPVRYALCITVDLELIDDREGT